MPKIQVGEETLFYEDRGDAEDGGVFLLIHGAAGCSSQWEDVANILANRYRVVALDLPGHGKSSGRGCRSVGAYLHAVRSFAAALNLHPFILCGQSMGGAIALEYTRKYPGEISALVLISSGARLRVTPLFLEICLEGDMDKLQILLMKYAFSPVIPLVQIQRWQRKWRFPPRDIVYGDFLACNNFDCLDGVEQVRLPTLILCGEEDRMTPPRYSRYLHGKIQNSRLEILSGGGHMLMVEKPRELCHALSEFVQTLPFPGRA